MAKYKVGDKVRIVSTPRLARWNSVMNKWLGETMTITSVNVNSNGEIFYRMAEDRGDFYGCGWCWYADMISGLEAWRAGREDRRSPVQSEGYLQQSGGRKGRR